MPIQRSDAGQAAPIKIWTKDIEESALKQLKNTASMPFIFKHVAAMPDVHAGLGSTVGSVVATKGAIMPACVGVDIGCGMSALKLEGIKPEDLDGKLAKLRQAIEAKVPVGFSVHKAEEGFKALANDEKLTLMENRKRIVERARDIKDPILEKALDRAGSQLGSLGGGNHFIEICVAKKSDSHDEDEVWLMFHSGSRGVGNAIGTHHIQKAKGLLKSAIEKKELADPDLAYFTEGSSEFDLYLSEMRWAQSYAFANRRAMQALLLQAINEVLGTRFESRKMDVIDCHHNYVSEEHHFGENVLVTRKGAVNAAKDQFGIIPGSMGARSFIVKGKGESESFTSCSHGAGRKMSRTEAKKRFNADDLKRQTLGIECRKDSEVVDEIPGAYKNIDEVMANQEDLVSIERILRQLVCVKG